MNYTMTSMLISFSAFMVFFSMISDLWSFLKLLISVEFINIISVMMASMSLSTNELIMLLTFLMVIVCEALVGLTLLVMVSRMNPYKMSFSMFTR